MRRPRPKPDPVGPGQESVWSYPRPPRVEPVEAELRVERGGEVIARTRRGRRVVETAGAPVYYFPPDDVRMEWLRKSGRGSYCEWKGRAEYWSLVHGDDPVPDIAWSYPDPVPGYESIAGWLAFYAGKVDGAWVGEMRAEPQPGGFYGGWVTPNIVGPIKGPPGTEGW